MKNSFESGVKNLAEIEARIGQFLPKPVIKSGIKRGEWHSGYGPVPRQKGGDQLTRRKAIKR